MRMFTMCFFVILFSACSFPGESTDSGSVPEGSPVDIAEPTQPIVALQATAVPAVEHRIGIRLVDGNGEFYNRLSGERFTPRGTN